MNYATNDGGKMHTLGRILVGTARVIGHAAVIVAKTIGGLVGARTFADENAVSMYKKPDEYRP
jgi:hypothetical protein